MQVLDNLLVIHNLDAKRTQIYDLKLEDWSQPLLKVEPMGHASNDIEHTLNNPVLNYSSVYKGKYLADLLAKEEQKY